MKPRNVHLKTLAYSVPGKIKLIRRATNRRNIIPPLSGPESTLSEIDLCHHKGVFFAGPKEHIIRIKNIVCVRAYKLGRVLWWKCDRGYCVKYIDHFSIDVLLKNSLITCTPAANATTIFNGLIRDRHRSRKLRTTITAKNNVAIRVNSTL